ncbi:hypothetical protein ELZ88_23985 (plasmid) [Salmonella enterica subsp. enterica serovar Karamoja]|uniref:Uncharacterized protein n=1 Tax=Salmonella enterica subsp. enterica serovar Karamoja TaxID=2500153 RepID=A0A3Q9MLJ1_SALET|nr:hypothetical protein ELZ88_23985 [Salmonella enterica subsp. enterica serovar Karamoja]AZT44301.1 hypothetical protein EL007_23860 [Salmonella enterica subsp. enterica serovar Karamoja]
MGWKPAAPEGPGRDSFAGSVRSMTAPVPAREVARRQPDQSGNTRSRMNNRSRYRQRNRKQNPTGGGENTLTR